MTVETVRKYIEYLRSLRGNSLLKRVTDDYRVYRETRNWLIDTLGSLEGKRLLEIGCGRLASTTLLLASEGAACIGVDVVYASRNNVGLKFLVNSLKENGIASASWELYLLVSGQLRDYYTRLSEISQLPLWQTLEAGQLSTKVGDACRLPFEDDSFDAVFSNAVMEHVSDIDTAFKEARRVLVPMGVTRHAIHLFPSPSGGHNPKWDEPGFDHWDHLLSQKHYVPTDLNRLRAADYISSFTRYFAQNKVLKEGTGEGADWLTPQLRSRLSSYSVDDLTTSGLVLIGQKETSG